jgi:hypothetical protein
VIVRQIMEKGAKGSGAMMEWMGECIQQDIAAQSARGGCFAL